MIVQNRPYRKFIILSSPRSGTHMLRTTLRNHPNIAACSELFNPDFIRNKPFGPETPALEILNKYIFRNYPDHIKMVGFIIHRSGTPFGDWPDLWSLLQEDKSIYVISLRRRNLLRRYLSYQTMRTFRGKPPQPLTFDPEVLKEDFIYQEKEVEAFDEQFAGHPIIKVYYEDLCSDYHRTVKKVLRFLRVKNQKLWPDEKGKPIRKLQEAIANYDELKTYLSQTKWAPFFDKQKVVHISKPHAVDQSRQLNFAGRLSARIFEYLKLRPYLFIKERYLLSWLDLCNIVLKNGQRKIAWLRPGGKSTFYKTLPIKGRSYYSRKAEELIIRSFFRDRKKGFFLDVGCAWPIAYSNTFFLEKHLGWSGIALDANPANKIAWKKYRPKSSLCTFIVTDHSGAIGKFYKAGGVGSTQKERLVMNKTVRGKEIELPTITLSQLLSDKGIEKIDFLTMDIEESELKALAGFDIERFRPDLVCIERTKRNKEKVLAYFEAHHYIMLEEYKPLDISNWYFVPK
ncbi:MAG: FkbM family methyltransferase [Saprospiraceae bacterium]|nr:FkbM family methyltransferase [Saprospiraceae bacterium]